MHPESLSTPDYRQNKCCTTQQEKKSEHAPQPAKLSNRFFSPSAMRCCSPSRSFHLRKCEKAVEAGGERERRSRAMTTRRKQTSHNNYNNNSPGTGHIQPQTGGCFGASALQRLIVQRCQNQNTERTRSGQVDSSNMRSRARRGAGHARGQGPCQL